MFPTSDNCCTRLGWKEYIAEYDGGDLHVSIAPDADLDDTLLAYCHDEGEMIKLNGWLFIFEEVEQC